MNVCFEDSGSFGVVRNIPSDFHSTDLRNFFSDFTENGRFRCFHFKHRPERIKPKDEVDESPLEATTFCCVFQAIGETALFDCIAKYNDANWIDDGGNYLKARCVIHKIKVSSNTEIDTNETSTVALESISGYVTRKEKGYKKRHAPVGDFSQNDLMSLSELRPPEVMPRGNVGTTIKEFAGLVQQCKLPPRIIKKLNLKFPKTGSTRRYGNVPLEYEDTWENLLEGENTYTANGDSVKTNVEVESDETTHKEEKPPLDTETPAGEISDPDADDDTCEEWERHEALHNDVTSMGRTKERLFEEEIELKWEKGGSGLVFYTDAQYWQEQEGDFDEQTTDDWDVDMREYYGERGDSDARQFLEMRREKRNGNAVYDDSLADNLCPSKLHTKHRSRSESPKSKSRGSFERHTKGIGRKLLEMGGWKEGDPLGPGKRSGGITDPVEVDGQHPKLRKGLGYHGEKLLQKQQPNRRRRKKRFIGNTRLCVTPSFRGNRSVEPMATHSWIFPQFASNLANNEYKERTRESRKSAIPGPDDGVVITTKYDEPLHIDEDDDFLRTQHPSALKHRTQKTDPNSKMTPSYSGSSHFKIRPGSKLVRPKMNISNETKPESVFKKPDIHSISRSTIELSAVKFVKAGDLNEK